MPDANNYKCACTDGYAGATCDQTDPCHVSPCQNFGTCVLTSSEEGTVGYRCDCVENFKLVFFIFKSLEDLIS